MRKNLVAWTEPELAAPGRVCPFVSVNREVNGLVTLEVRQADGKHAQVSMTFLDWTELLLTATAADRAA